jgi:FkbM family methyltransferase
MKEAIRAVIGQKSIKYSKFWRTKIFEAVGIERFSYPALYNIDRQLISLFNKKDGIFVEVGANDGFTQSNTYALEMLHGWRGLLIEPLPDLFRLCKRFRPNATVANCALQPAIDGDYDAKSDLVMMKSDLKSSVVDRTVPNAIKVPAVTLSFLLNEFKLPPVDLFSLDVEGFELEVLRGLDLSQHRPCYILVETNKFAEVASLLSGSYSFHAQMSHHDYLFRSHHIAGVDNGP